MTTVRRLLAQIGASIESRVDGGTRWEIRVPQQVLQAAAQ
jgi:two-component sensor histidine kinase